MDKETYLTHNVWVYQNYFALQKFDFLPNTFAISLQFRSDCISLYINLSQLLSQLKMCWFLNIKEKVAITFTISAAKFTFIVRKLKL
jgi:hypothetical protein